MPRYTMQDAEQLYVREIGKGPSVLVLSGLGMQSWQWLAYLLPQIKHYKFIIPDWRGFGDSKQCKIPPIDAISSHWQDIECLIEQLNLDDFILIGYSMGATTAMHGMKYGQLATKLKAYLHIDQTPKIVSDATWEYGLLGHQHPELKQLLSELSSLLQQQSHLNKINDLDAQQQENLLSLWIKFIQLQGSNKFTAKVFKLALNLPKLQKHILPIQRLDYLSWYVDSYLNQQEDYRDAIASLTCPVTFFIGEQSTLYPSEGQLLVSSSIKHAKTIIFHKSGHAPLLTEPFKFRGEIANFLKKQSIE